jgi:hypothetical protein
VALSCGAPLSTTPRFRSSRALRAISPYPSRWEDGRTPSMLDIQTYGEAAERWRAELDSIRFGPAYTSLC